MSDSTCTFTMLSIQEKKPLPIQTLQSSSPMDEALEELLKFRHRLTQSSSESSESRLRQLLSYFNSLAKIKPRYTVALKQSGLETIHFSWQDSFKPSKSYTHTSINSEKVAVVFNIAAEYSQMAASETRATQEGLKEAFKAFSNAAGALRFLRERFVGGESVDVSKICVSMLEKVMLAQAQECVFQMAIWSGKLPSTCSQIARQVELYYEEINCVLTSSPLDRHLDKAWFSHIKLKASLFYAKSCYHYAINLHRQELIGEEITRLRMGIDHLKKTRKTIRGASASLISAVSRLEGIMNSSLEKAEDENDGIYYSRIPAASSLSELKALVMDRPQQLESLTSLEDGDCNCSCNK